jgi:hypothetical protein
MLKASSLTAVMFVFQACYGMPSDYHEDIFISGKVVSKSSQLPIQGIKVSVKGLPAYTVTNENGEFRFYSERRSYSRNSPYDSLMLSYPEASYCPLQFQDIDAADNGSYADTLLYINIWHQHEVKVNIQLENAESNISKSF